MSFFFTEQRTEELLEREIRVVPGPGGVPVSIDGFKAFWKAYGFLVLSGVHTAERLAEWAERTSAITGEHFGNALSDIVWRSNDDVRRMTGIDCFAVRPRR